MRCANSSEPIRSFSQDVYNNIISRGTKQRFFLISQKRGNSRSLQVYYIGLYTLRTTFVCERSGPTEKMESGIPVNWEIRST